MSRPKLVSECIEDGCQREAISRGRCNKHYIRWYRKQKGECSVEGCSGDVHARGLCFTHYKLMPSDRDGNNRAYPINIDSPEFNDFLFEFPIYDAKADGLKCPRNLPPYVLDRKKTQRKASVGEWHDAPMKDRPSIPRNYTPQENGVVDWSKKK